MYAAFFGLRGAPFTIAPDPRFLFMSERHREALAHLVFGLQAGGGFVLLTGDIGAGKTTLCRCLLEQVPPACQVAYIFNPRLSVPELLRTVCEEFGVAVPPGASSVKDHIDPLNAHLLSAHAAGRHCVLIVDEAQNLPAEVLEQLRLLTNLETPERKLLQIILIGQPELRQMLARPELEQLAQRVIARYHLGPLTEAETRAYVQHRMLVAGRQGPLPFTDKALQRIHRLSGGVPRRINLLCDRALLGAWAHGHAAVEEPTVQQAAREVFEGIGAPSGQMSRTGPLLRRSLLALLGLVVIGGLAFMLGSHGRTDGLTSRDAAMRPQPTASAPPASSPPQAASSASAPSPASSAAAPWDGQAAELVLDANRWPLTDERSAWRLLATHWEQAWPAGPVARACSQTSESLGLACLRNTQGHLTLIRALDRPVLLSLPTAREAGTHGGSWVVLSGLDGQRAWLQRPDGPAMPVPLRLLAAHWQGEWATLWRPLPGTAAATRSRGLTASAAEALTSQLDRLSVPPAANDDLSARLRTFQASEGLHPDGLAGPVTVMLLHRRAGLPGPRLTPSPSGTEHTP